jgi:hypothetical protein
MNDLIFCIIYDTKQTTHTHTITIFDKATIWIKNHIHTPLVTYIYSLQME